MTENKINFNLNYFTKENDENLKTSLERNFNELFLAELIDEISSDKKIQNRFINKYERMINNVFYRNKNKNYGVLNSIDLKIYYLGFKENFKTFFETEGMTISEEIEEWFIQIFGAIAMARSTEKYVTNRSLSVTLKNILIEKLNSIFIFNRIIEGIISKEDYTFSYGDKGLSPDIFDEYIKKEDFNLDLLIIKRKSKYYK